MSEVGIYGYRDTLTNNIKDLKEKVISKGLEWGIIDSEKAIKIMERD